MRQPRPAHGSPGKSRTYRRTYGPDLGPRARDLSRSLARATIQLLDSGGCLAPVHLLHQPKLTLAGYPCGVGGAEATAGGVAGIAARSTLFAGVSM